MTGEPHEKEQAPEAGTQVSGAAGGVDEAERRQSHGSAGTSQGQAGGRRRGCNLFTGIIVLVVLLAVVAYLAHQAQLQQQRRLEEERAQRHAVRQTQIGAIGDDIAKALQFAQEGDLAKSLMILEAQENLLATIAREASASGDHEDATQIVELKSAVSQVASAIRQKQQELNELAVQQIASLGSKFPQVKQAAARLEAQPTQQEEQNVEHPSGQAPVPSGGGEQPPQGQPTTAPSTGEPAQQPAAPQPSGPGP